MMTAIDVKNYKVLDNLRVDGLEQINIFVGKNNCGKTSLLEAIFLKLNPYPNQLAVFVIGNEVRNIQLTNDNLDTFFYRLNKDNPIEITSSHDNNETTLIITPNYQFGQASSSTALPSIEPAPFGEMSMLEQNKPNTISQISNRRISGLNFRLQSNSALLLEGGFDLNGSSIVVKSAEPPLSSSSGLFITSNILSINMRNIANINNIKMNKKEEKLLPYLQLFDEDINKVEIVNNVLMVNLKSMPKLIGAYIMGEGFRKFIAIIASLINEGITHICIDEIENGLHFETIEKLLRSIVGISKKSQIQLFITTHNLELLKVFARIIREEDYSNFAIFNIARTKLDGLQAYKYNRKSLEHTLETETEFRD